MSFRNIAVFGTICFSMIEEISEIKTLKHLPTTSLIDNIEKEEELLF